MGLGRFDPRSTISESTCPKRTTGEHPVLAPNGDPQGLKGRQTAVGFSLGFCTSRAPICEKPFRFNHPNNHPSNKGGGGIVPSEIAGVPSDGLAI